ncbi:hypothetical protein MUCCIDRAFT_161234 [Mucor lusitanicus CBS 277.49]|uniref:SP-RING-type domain-containing protein n=1 Tax=Mucor lusitanicus CBS 277.49 TaxID=747725 RepID=A0A168M7B6_MUCCL|nr:hypothetical protein MUCCIDRAFT_161234 [Mucor lusitanicus CBS 277.49]
METQQSLQDIKDGFALTARTNFKPSLANDITDVYYLIQNAQNLLTLAAQSHEENNNKAMVDELDEAFKDFVNLEYKMNLQRKSFETLKQRIATGEKITDPIAYYENLKQTFNAESPDDATRINADQKYLSFKQHLWNINHPDEEMPSLRASNDDDDDIVMGPTKISLKCPITMLWLDEPVTRVARAKEREAAAKEKEAAEDTTEFYDV